MCHRYVKVDNSGRDGGEDDHGDGERDGGGNVQTLVRRGLMFCALR